MLFVVVVVPQECVARLVTPAATEAAQRHFKCSTLAGAELENDVPACGFVRSAWNVWSLFVSWGIHTHALLMCRRSLFGSHWEQRIFQDELMCPSSSHGARTYLSAVTVWLWCLCMLRECICYVCMGACVCEYVSLLHALQLGLLEDSGWYAVNFSVATPIARGSQFGVQLGCPFATSKCLQSGATPVPSVTLQAFDEPQFCTSVSSPTTAADYKCTPDRYAVVELY